MICSAAESLIHSMSLNLRVIRMQTDGLSHEDSVLQLPFRGNCLNWVLGHILVGRSRALKLLGESPLMDVPKLSRYESGSEPITTAEQALPLSELLSSLDESQDRLSAALRRISADALAEMVQAAGRESPLGQVLVGLQWHETYHTGQLELLRQLAGTDDAIV